MKVYGPRWIVTAAGSGRHARAARAVSPAKAVEERLTEPAPRAKRSERPMPRVLVVDDQEDILQTTALVLAKGGYEALTATNGFEALETARRERPDLILLDVEMPRMDGWETLRLLRLDDATVRIPVAMFTILFDLREKVRAMKYGAQDYITKPFSIDDLLGRVARLLAAPSAGSLEVS